MPTIENKLITSTNWKPGDDPKDGIGLCDKQHWHIKNCIIDLTKAPEGSVDEACGITWGSSAVFENCVIRGAGKLVLCGCGDSEKEYLERGKSVSFTNCILENFSRRGPEVQGGMEAFLFNCIVANWGDNDQFDTRAFGAWAHDGGIIKASGTIFLQGNTPTLKHWLLDHVNHFGQAVNERGFFKALFHRDAWLSGYKRALTQGPGGSVEAVHCFASDGLIVDNWLSKMNQEQALELTAALKLMKSNLAMELDWRY